MSRYKVNADFLINVSTWVDADSEEEASRLGLSNILAKDCEFQDPINEPTINWVELDEDHE